MKQTIIAPSYNTLTSDQIAVLFYAWKKDYDAMRRMNLQRFSEAQISLKLGGYLNADYTLTEKGKCLFVN